MRGEGENTFRCRSIEVGHGFLTHSNFFQLLQEVESLVGFTDFETGVKSP